jgi:hypothetical protein
MLLYSPFSRWICVCILSHLARVPWSILFGSSLARSVVYYSLCIILSYIFTLDPPLLDLSDFLRLQGCPYKNCTQVNCRVLRGILKWEGKKWIWLMRWASWRYDIWLTQNILLNSRSPMLGGLNVLEVFFLWLRCDGAIGPHDWEFSATIPPSPLNPVVHYIHTPQTIDKTINLFNSYMKMFRNIFQNLRLVKVMICGEQRYIQKKCTSQR